MNRYEVRRLNLIKIKDELCDGVITKLADKLEKPHSFVSRLLYEDNRRHKKNISDKVAEDIERAFNLPQGGLDSTEINNEISRENNKITGMRIDLLDIQASCGSGVSVVKEFDNVLKSIEFTHDYAMKLFGRRSIENIKVITAKGDSMSPTIKSGANIFVDTSINHFDGDGVYVFVFDDEIYVKRIQITGTEIIVLSDNSLYKTWEMKKEFAYKFHIQGKVLLGQNLEYIYFD